jgi:hypothetical protein
MKELKLEHIAGYLPWGLKFIHNGVELEFIRIKKTYTHKPILKPMTKEVLEEVFGNMNISTIHLNISCVIISFNTDTNREIYWIKNHGSLDNCPKWIIDRFHKHHVDYQDLISQGLAVNELTLKQ